MRYLVVDLGSSNGKIYEAELTGKRKLKMREIDRFPMERIFLKGHITTDLFSIYARICKAIKILAEQGNPPDSLGIDSWCSDYGLMDTDSGAVVLPVFYRDHRTDGYTEKVEAAMNYREVYELTTQRKIQDSTLCQLLSYQSEYPDGLTGNKKLMFIGDILMYFFSGKLCTEISVASYSQLFSTRKEDWEPEMFERFNLPVKIAPPVVRPGTRLGLIDETLAGFLGTKQIAVTSPAVHDTASAAVAVPAGEGENWAFLATGSWFLMSMELDCPADTEKSFRYQLSNTGMAFGKVLLKKNITAMWLVQECKRQWEDMGLAYTYPELAKMAGEAREFSAMVDTEYEGFYHPGNMVSEICSYLKYTGQEVPGQEDAGAVVRIIYESIVLQSVRALRMLEDTTEKSVDVLYVIGGANRIKLMNQFLADALGIPVRTGPVEASAMGNALLQAYGMGELSSAGEVREAARQSCPVKEYMPRRRELWERQYEKYLKLLGIPDKEERLWQKSI